MVVALGKELSQGPLRRCRPSVFEPLDLTRKPLLGRRSLILGLELGAFAGQTNAAKPLKLFSVLSG